MPSVAVYQTELNNCLTKSLVFDLNDVSARSQNLEWVFVEHDRVN